MKTSATKKASLLNVFDDERDRDRVRSHEVVNLADRGVVCSGFIVKTIIPTLELFVSSFMTAITAMSVEQLQISRTRLL